MGDDVEVAAARLKARPARRWVFLVAALAILAVGCEADGDWVDTQPLTLGRTEVAAGQDGVVECWSATGCITAVGATSSLWDGATWRDVTPEGWSGSGDDGRQHLSCTSATFCLTTAARMGAWAPFAWNGTSWAPTADPAGLLDANHRLQAVACSSPTSCGGFRRGDLADTFVRWDGVAWAEAPAPVSGGWRGMRIACGSPANCVAFLDADADGDEDLDVVAVRWTGAGWTALPAPGFEQYNVADLECPTASTCFAAGSIDGRWRVVRLAGSAWEPIDDKFGGFQWQPVVTCAPGTEVCRVYGSGYEADAMGNVDYRNVEVTLSPGPVRRTYLPSAFGFLSSQFDVDCGAADACVALVQDFLGIGNPGRYAGVGSAWTRTPDAPGRSYPVGALGPVDCPTDTFCAGVALGRAQVWDGAGWREVPAPPAAGDPTDIDCTGPSFCLAVGYVYGPSGIEALRWDGSTWTSVPVPAEVGLIRHVTCTSTTYCLAVGAEGRELLRFDGSSFTTAARPPMVVSSVSCVRADWCMAAGTAELDDNGSHARVAHWNGSGWTVDDAVDPVFHSSWFNDISCASESLCIAAGAMDDNGAQPMVGTWDGTVWRHSRPSAVRDVLLGHVSCAPGRCTAVGNSQIDASAFVVTTGTPATLEWEPTAPIPTGSDPVKNLQGVACRPGWCLVGGSHQVGGTTAPLGWRFVPA